MSYVGIDTQGARALGQVLQDTAGRVDGVRQSVSAALNLADLASEVPARLALVHDGFTALAAGVTDKAALAEQFAVDPHGTAARLGAPVDALGTAIRGLLGFAGPADLRQVLVGLPVPGADPALDGALARLNPVLLPAFQAGQRPELTEAQAADLKLLALALGIEHAGPPVAPVAPDNGEEVAGFLGRFRLPAARVWALREPKRTGTEVFWHDFWTGGRTVDSVLADPALVLEWVAGTFELDRRLALATALPSLGDVLTSVDFGNVGSDPGELAAILAAAETEFAAIDDWLPAFLVGQDRTAPDATQLAQTLAFAGRVGWPDPGAGAASEQERFADAIAFLRANRALQSALLPTGFEGDGDPLAFFNAPGIGFVLDLGRRAGVLDDAVLGTIAGTVDHALAAFGVDMSGPAPVALTEQFQQQLVALLGTQIPRSMLEKPATQAQFIAALGFLRQATTGPEQRQRLIDVLAAFRTLAVTGAPALTERQLVAAVGQQVLDVLGRGRLRLRSEGAVRKNPEFLLVARQWGLPGSKKQDLGKYKFSWSFNDLGELTGIRRKKKSWLSRVWDTIKSVGEAIWKSWEDNPLKAIFQIGKIALGAAAFFVPGLQGLGAAAFALNAGEAVFHAVEGDWLAAIGSGLSAFTTGVSDVFRAVPATALEIAQGQFVSSLFGESNATFDLLKNVRAAFDIGTSIFNATQADTLVGAIAAGLGAAVTTVGSGGQLLSNLKVIDKTFLQDLTRLGLTVADISRLVAPAAGLVDALDRDNVLAAFGNGLSLLSAGARIVSNPDGAFSGPRPAGGIFQFDKETRDQLFELSQGTGVAAGITKAIDAAERGDRFAVGTFLAQAVQAANDPGKTEFGSRARVAERIAEIGVLLEAVFDRKASPAHVAPLVVQRLQAVLDAANTPLKKPDTQPNTAPAAGTTTTRPSRPGLVLAPQQTGQASTLPFLFQGFVPGSAPAAGGENVPPVSADLASSAPMRLGGPVLPSTGGGEVTVTTAVVEVEDAQAVASPAVLGNLHLAASNPLPDDDSEDHVGTGDEGFLVLTGGPPLLGERRQPRVDVEQPVGRPQLDQLGPPMPAQGLPELTFPGTLERDIPPPGTAPFQVSLWWGSLTPDLRQLYQSQFPERIGALDGLPAADRHTANMTALDAMIAAQADRVMETRPVPPTLMQEGSPGVPVSLGLEISRLERLLGLRSRVMATQDVSEAERLYLLGIDDRGDGQAIVSVGNPDTARSVGVLVPGMWVHLDDVYGVLIDRATNLRTTASLLDTSGAPGHAATVVWLYDTPDGIFQPVGSGSAVAAAQGLGRFIDGLHASNQRDQFSEDPTGYVVFPHSYGTRAVAEALLGGYLNNTNINAIATVGAPGMGVPYASYFAFDGPIFSGANPNDPVPVIGPLAHGPAPDRWEFGGIPFSVGPTGPSGPWYLFGYNVDEHSRYWELNSESLNNQARILIGDYRNVTLNLDTLPPGPGDPQPPDLSRFLMGPPLYDPTRPLTVPPLEFLQTPDPSIYLGLPPRTPQPPTGVDTPTVPGDYENKTLTGPMRRSDLSPIPGVTFVDNQTIGAEGGAFNFAFDAMAAMNLTSTSDARFDYTSAEFGQTAGPGTDVLGGSLGYSGFDLDSLTGMGNAGFDLTASTFNFAEAIDMGAYVNNFDPSGSG